MSKKSKQRKQRLDYVALSYFIGFLSNVVAGMLATFFGITGTLFYGRNLDAVDLGAVVLGVSLMGGAGYFAYKLTKAIKV